MIPVQPTLFWKYFHSKRTQFPPGISTSSYLSWEDGLWDIMRSFSIKKNSKVLVPSFFCVDVMNNMKNHGLEPMYYDVDSNLQPDKKKVLSAISKIKPQIIILFHPVGISNKLVTETFFKKLPRDIFVIEDCVHRITSPSEVILYNSNHFIINSFRKVVPLQGSLVIGNEQTISKLQRSENTFWYTWSVVLLWIGMQVCLMVQKYVNERFGKWAEDLMLKGYNIIGDEYFPGNCPAFFSNLYQYLDFKKIKRIKQKQVIQYEHLLIKSDFFYTPKISQADKKELRGYPIITSKKTAIPIINSFRKQDIYIRPELDDSKWSKQRTIMYLPLGPHIDSANIVKITSILNKAVLGVT